MAIETGAGEAAEGEVVSLKDQSQVQERFAKNYKLDWWKCKQKIERERIDIEIFNNSMTVLAKQSNIFWTEEF